MRVDPRIAEAVRRILDEEIGREAERFAYTEDPDDPEIDLRAAEAKDRAYRRAMRRCFWWGFTHPFVGRAWMFGVLLGLTIATIALGVWSLS